MMTSKKKKKMKLVLGDRYWYETIENSKFKGNVGDVENRDESALFLQAGDKIAYYDGTFGIARHKRLTRIVWIRVSKKDAKQPKYLMELENRASLNKSIRVLRLEDHEGNKVKSSWEQIRKHLMIKSEMKGMDEMIDEKTKALYREGVSEIQNADNFFGSLAKDLPKKNKSKTKSKVKKTKAKKTKVKKKKSSRQLSMKSFLTKKETPKTKKSTTKTTKSPKKKMKKMQENMDENVGDEDFEDLVWKKKKKRSFTKNVKTIESFMSVEVSKDDDDDDDDDAFVEKMELNFFTGEPEPCSEDSAKKKKKKKKKKKTKKKSTPNSKSKRKTPLKKSKKTTPSKKSKEKKKTPSKKRKTPSKTKKTPSKKRKTPSKTKKTPSKKRKTPSKTKKNSKTTPKKKKRKTPKKKETKSNSIRTPLANLMVVSDDDNDSSSDDDWSDDENGTISFMGATLALST